MNRRTALYCRVSTGGQTPDNQLLRLREVASNAGWTIVWEYVETVSGAKVSRPLFNQMMADARRRRFDLIAAVDVSRLGRSLSGLTALFDELAQLGIDLYLDREAVDTSTPSGRALLGMASVFATFERDMIVERTHAGLARAKARGVRLGRPPTGEQTLAVIEALRARGLGQNAIARQLGVGKSVVQRVCKSFTDATHASLRASD